MSKDLTYFGCPTCYKHVHDIPYDIPLQLLVSEVVLEKILGIWCQEERNLSQLFKNTNLFLACGSYRNILGLIWPVGFSVPISGLVSGLSLVIFSLCLNSMYHSCTVFVWSVLCVLQQVGYIQSFYILSNIVLKNQFLRGDLMKLFNFPFVFISFALCIC